VIISPGKPLNAQQRVASPMHSCPDISGGSRITHARKYLEKHLGIDNAAATRDGSAAGDAGYSALPTDNPSTYIQSRNSGESANDHLQSLRMTDLIPLFSLGSP
jgi:hypothetical protein